MGEGSNDPASKDLLPPDIPTLVQRCLKVEQDRSLSDNSMKEPRRYKECLALMETALISAGYWLQMPMVNLFADGKGRKRNFWH